MYFLTEFLIIIKLYIWSGIFYLNFSQKFLIFKKILNFKTRAIIPFLKSGIINDDIESSEKW